MKVTKIAEIYKGTSSVLPHPYLTITDCYNDKETLFQDMETSRKYLMKEGFEYKQALGDSNGMLQSEIWIKTNEI